MGTKKAEHYFKKAEFVTDTDTVNTILRKLS